MSAPAAVGTATAATVVIITSLVMQRDASSLAEIKRGFPRSASPEERARRKSLERVRKLLRYILCVEVGHPVRHVAAALGYKHHGEVMDANEEVERWREDPYVDDMISDLGDAVNRVIEIVEAFQATGAIDDPEAALQAMGKHLREKRAGMDEPRREMVAA